MILDALRQGHCFIGYDLPAPTLGFHFVAHGMESSAKMGNELDHKGGITFQIRLPMKTECVLFKDGKPLRTWHNHDLCTYITAELGVYGWRRILIIWACREVGFSVTQCM
jgi:hypothetical protein